MTSHPTVLQNYKPLYFVIGSDNSESRVIVDLLKNVEAPLGYASTTTSRITPSVAHLANSIQKSDGSGKEDLEEIAHRYCVVMVDCNVPAISVADHLTHANNKEFSRFWDNSAIGQVCNLLNIDRNTRVIQSSTNCKATYNTVAAATHCLPAAYSSLCDGVTPDAVLAWRIASRAEYQGVSEEVVAQNIKIAADIISHAPRFRIGTVEVADLNTIKLPREAQDGAAIAEIPIVYSHFDVPTKSFKYGIFNGDPMTTYLWMYTVARRMRLVNVYGAPYRGFAGGYRIKNLEAPKKPKKVGRPPAKAK